METLLAIGICLLGFFGIPIVILWIRDRLEQLLGETFLSLVAGVSLLFGISMACWIVYKAFYPTTQFQRSYFIYIGFAVPAVMIWYGVRRLFYFSGGVEEQEIDFNSPELLASKDQARATLGYFTQQAEKHIDGAFVKFPLQTDEDFTEHIWGYVHHYADEVFNISVANDTFATGEYGMRMDVPEADVEDWMIMLPDGTVKGGFSIIAGFRYLENKGRKLNKTMRKQKQALIDFDRPTAS